MLAPVVAKRNLETIRDDDEPKDEMVFEDDFIDDDENVIEDDFVEDEAEKDPFVLLQNATTVLEESLRRGGPPLPAWKYGPSEPAFLRTKDVAIPSYVAEAASCVTASYNVESLRAQLEKEIGDDQTVELYRHLQTPNNPESARYIRDFEKKNPKAVRDVRNLIYLEETI
jgi:hypothetical protein